MNILETTCLTRRFGRLPAMDNLDLALAVLTTIGARLYPNLAR